MMEFTANKSAIEAGLYKAQGVVDKKSTVNILSHVLIESLSATEIRFTCTDYDVVLTGTYPAEVTQPGKMAVNAKNLYEVVRMLPDAPVQLSRMDNHWAELRCGSSKFKLMGLPPDDFPEQRPLEELSWFTVSKRVLLDLIERTLFSVSHDETRPSLNGVFFRAVRDGDDVRLLMVSTDGHRLSKSEGLGSDPGLLQGGAEAILHHKAVSELKRCLEGPSTDVKIAFHRQNLCFLADEVMLQVRKLDEAFPEYQKVIPKSLVKGIDFDRAELTAAVRRIATLTSAKTNIIRLEIKPGRLVLWSANPDAGEGRDEIAIDYEGEELVVGFNYKYLLDVLGVIHGEKIVLSINDQYSPGLLTSPDDEGSLFVIMPMRL